MAAFQSPDEALPAAEEAVAIYRSQMSPGLAGDLPNFAAALSNLGNRLSAAGRAVEALEVSEETVAVYLRLADANPAHVLGLVATLQSHGLRLFQLGRQTEAARAMKESFRILHNHAV